MAWIPCNHRHREQRELVADLPEELPVGRGTQVRTDQEQIEVSAIHEPSGYRRVRELLASQYNIGDREPNLQVVNVDRRGDRSLTLRHTEHRRRPLGQSTQEVLKHLHRLWGFPVHVEVVHEDGAAERLHSCPPADKAA